MKREIDFEIRLPIPKGFNKEAEAEFVKLYRERYSHFVMINDKAGFILTGAPMSMMNEVRFMIMQFLQQAIRKSKTI